MIYLLKRICLIFVISIAIEAICLFLRSHFLVSFLVSKIVELQITLIAINTATCTFIVSKLQEVSKLYNQDFSTVYIEIKNSLFRQIALIILSISILTIRESLILQPIFNSYPNFQYVFGVLIIFSLICSIDILRDTGASMFNILIRMDSRKDDPK